MTDLTEFSREYIALSNFNPTNKAFLQRLLDDLTGYAGRIMRVDHACELFFILRQIPDEEFPSGKWALIQALEGQIDEAIKRELSREKVTDA